MGSDANELVWPIDIRLLNIKKHRQSLYTVEWQIKRIGYKGRWNSADLPDIIKELQKYIKDAQHDEQPHEYVARMYRVLNCLDAVYMGWKDKDAVPPKRSRFLDEFLSYKEELSGAYHEMLFTVAIKWPVDSEDKIKLDWIRAPHSIKKVLLKDLFKRFFGSTKRWEKGSKHERLMHTLKSRSELYWFLSIVAPTELSEVLSEYNR
jgi:hypothetical protein